jgi:chemotaxis protein MotB
VRKKKHEEEESGSERWLVSYADFITLLFAFFTTLYAISTVDAQKAGKLVNSMRASFDSNLFAAGSPTISLNPGTGGNPAAHELLKAADMRGEKLKELDRMRNLRAAALVKKETLNVEGLKQLKQRIETIVGTDLMREKVRTRIDSRGLIITLGEAGIFDSGSDQIKPEGKALLQNIAGAIINLGNQIRVEGHTDNVPIRNPKFPSNWELSTARATAMISYLIDSLGFTAEQLSAAGYAEYRPAAPNSTEEGKARNRRVDIVVLNPATAAVEPK